MKAKLDLPILLFPDSKAWLAWLKAKHASHAGFWMRIAKKGAALKSINYDQGVDGALRYGWIDGQKQTYDAQSWLQRFAPRRPRSNWSLTNTRKVDALIKAGAMRAAGMKEVEAAKKDGRWKNAYGPQSEMKPPKALVDALAKNTKAQKFFEQLDKANRYAFMFRIHAMGKPETKAKRLVKLVKMLEENKKIHG